jgi:Fic family protein
VILFELTESEDHQTYQALQISNGDRHYSFLQSIVAAALEVQRPFLSQTILRAINYHAIACLHAHAGDYRPCEVVVGTHNPPAFYRVPSLMDDFVNTVNRHWERTGPVELASYVLWRLNYIHPFINGNGRTARAASYFALCCKSGGWLAGDRILPELLRANRSRYVDALKQVDKSFHDGALDMTVLNEMIAELLTEQLEGANEDGD